jgi:integrase
MSVRKRAWTTRSGDRKEAWIVDYIDQAGTRHIKTFERKKEADAHQATVRVDVRAGIHTSSKETIAQAGEKWIEDAVAAELEPATIESYRQHLKDHIVPYLGSVKLSELTLPTARQFMDRLRADGRSKAMIKRVVGDVGSILADAQERGTVAQNVVRSLSRRNKSRRKADHRKKPRLEIGKDIPSIDEIRRIVANLDGRWRPLLLTVIFTGLRASELRGLRWADVDFKKAELHVRQRADKFKTIGAPKSKAGQRTIPLVPILVSTLRRWKIACPPSDHDLVFPTGAGHIEYHSNIVTRGLGPVQIAAGVVTRGGKPKYTGLHALRHFYASWCINRREDGGLGLLPKRVQELMGHSSITMTMDTYGHLFPRGDDGAELAAAQKALLG